MKTLSFLLLVGACGSASLSMGCLFGGGCDAVNNGYRTPVVMTPASTLAFRTPGTCGVMNPAFGASDSFALDLTGDANITVDVTPAVVEGQSIPLVVSAAAGSTTSFTAEAQDGSVHFSFELSSSAAASMDTTALDAVIVTVTALPTADGQPFAAELHLSFDDGRVLDQTYSAPVQTTYVQCK